MIIQFLDYIQTPACNYTISEATITKQTSADGRLLPSEFIKEEVGGAGFVVNIGSDEYNGYNNTF